MQYYCNWQGNTLSDNTYQEFTFQAIAIVRESRSKQKQERIDNMIPQLDKKEISLRMTLNF